MIRTTITIDGIEYTVRANTDQEVLKAVEFLKEQQAAKEALPQFELTSEGEITAIELELNQSFDQLLQDIESGDVVLPTNEQFKVTAASTTPAGTVNESDTSN